MKLSSFDTPDGFFQSIPRDITQNIEYRKELHTILAKDKNLQKLYLALISEQPKIAFNSALWTFNPRLPKGFRNRPFILWPGQEPAIDMFNKGHKERFDIVVHKSRDEGATELIRAYLNILFLTDPQMMALVGSEKAEKVDTSVILDKRYNLSGSPKCLMYKLCYGLVTLPEWMRPRVTKSYMHLENNENGAVIDGESTNQNFALSDRRDVTLLDEIGCVEPSIAETIIANIPDVCDFNIYNSTHHLGPGHPYDQLLHNDSIHVVQLLWFNNPKKAVGLYETPEIGFVQLKDKDYYKNTHPGLFESVADTVFRVDTWRDDMKAKYPSRVDEINDIIFEADGGISFGKKRSIWFDKEVKRRGGSVNYICQNILGEAGGSGRMTFTTQNLAMVKKFFVRPPTYTGELEYSLDVNGRVTTAKFTTGYDSGRLRWYGPLFSGRPNQAHRYVLAIDPSRGTGAANACIGIYDVNTNEEIGKWVCPNTPEERLADVVWAMRQWVHDISANVYIIWEANGAGAFENKIKWHGCTNYFVPRAERTRVRGKRQNRCGWWSNTALKHDLLRELDVAVGRGLEETPTYKFIRIYDADTVREMESYIESPTGFDGPSALIAESNGARAAHGDRVIPPALYVLARKYYSPLDAKPAEQEQPLSSMARRMEDFKKAQRAESYNRFLYTG